MRWASAAGPVVVQLEDSIASLLVGPCDRSCIYKNKADLVTFIQPWRCDKILACTPFPRRPLYFGGAWLAIRLRVCLQRCDQWHPRHLYAIRAATRCLALVLAGIGGRQFGTVWAGKPEPQ